MCWFYYTIYFDHFFLMIHKTICITTCTIDNCNNIIYDIIRIYLLFFIYNFCTMLLCLCLKLKLKREKKNITKGKTAQMVTSNIPQNRTIIFNIFFLCCEKGNWLASWLLMADVSVFLFASFLLRCTYFLISRLTVTRFHILWINS